VGADRAAHRFPLVPDTPTATLKQSALAALADEHELRFVTKALHSAAARAV